jgi:GNAT superfamily N-acetyltransferase
MKGLHLTELIDPGSELARQAFELYETSFPIVERDPLVRLQQGIARHAEGQEPAGERAHYGVAIEAGRVAGLSFYGYYRPARLGYLAYLATQPETRGRGLGAWLFDQTLRGLAADARELGGPPPLGLCWEVERPDDAEAPAARLLRERRIGFYRRQGAVLLDDVRFVAPPMDAGLPSLAFYLMFKQLPGEPVGIDRELKRAIIDATLLYGYGLERDSPYYLAATAALATQATGPQ